MPVTLIIAISLHVLSATFWAGTTFAMARDGGEGARHLFVPQTAAAAIAILTGCFLWLQLHEGSAGPMERVLGLGAISAVVAIVLQFVSGITALRASAGGPGAGAAGLRLLAANRVAALLLAVATMAMAAAKYF